MHTHWQNDWRNIGVRIDGVIEAARVAKELSGKLDGGLPGYLHLQWNDVFSLLSELFTTHRSVLPPMAVARFDSFVAQHQSVIKANDCSYEASRIGYLVGLRAELDVLLADSQVRLRMAAERAFLHLQRLLVADRQFSQKWYDTFADGREPDCEKLGAVHLLHHGIAAFKADGAGGQTDLILGTSLLPDENLLRAVDGFVLTEWKVLRDPKSARRIAEEALDQAERYVTGVLVGLELAATRYVVIVSEKECVLPEDKSFRGVLYRHINIAVRPQSPSTAARARTS